MMLHQLIKRPLITEKNTYHSTAGTYVFEVSMNATKIEIKAAVEKAFQVKVAAVRTSIGRGRARRTRFGYGRKPYTKKAFVSLRAGEKISLFEGV